MKINILKLSLAAILAAIVIFGAESVANAVILKTQWEVWAAQAKKAFIAPSMTYSMSLWALQSVIGGIGIAWIFACDETRMANRLNSALKAGFIVWFVGWFGAGLDKMAMGVQNGQLMHINLIAALLGCLIGGWLISLDYKD